MLTKRDTNPNAATMDFFRSLAKNTLVILFEVTGEWVWIHDHVDPDGKHVHGTMIDTGNPVTYRDVGPYLYECEGVVCCGSSADPVYFSHDDFHADQELEFDEEDEDDDYNDRDVSRGNC